MLENYGCLVINLKESEREQWQPKSYNPGICLVGPSKIMKIFN
jgi:hypothetical protein